MWNFVEATVRDVFRAYNFHEIRTPIFESTELFARGVGEETDVVAKEMYTWEDRGRTQSDKGQSLTLRPENTAGVVRAYIEHKLSERGLNKLYYIGPQFRRERPQKGRYRQFNHGGPASSIVSVPLPRERSAALSPRLRSDQQSGTGSRLGQELWAEASTSWYFARSASWSRSRSWKVASWAAAAIAVGRRCFHT